MTTAIDLKDVRAVLDALVASRIERDRERKRIVVGKVIGRRRDWLAPFQAQIRNAFELAGRSGHAGGWEAASYLDDGTLDAIFERGYADAWDIARCEDHEAYDGDCGYIDGLTEAIDRLSVLTSQR
jgi:hypothetical protein